MLDKKGFDAWSGEYDESIKRYSNGYPFEGYYNVLSYVHSQVNVNRQVKILDIGIGTGLLTRELHKKGGKIYGVDFSQKMIELAKEKIPNGIFYCFDFKYGLPDELKGEKFDYIVSSYAIHHITDEEKVIFIKELKNNLAENGLIILADVAFETREKMEECKEISGRAWDNDEFYMIAEDLIPRLTEVGLNVTYTQISPCAGALEIKAK